MRINYWFKLATLISLAFTTCLYADVKVGESSIDVDLRKFKVFKRENNQNIRSGIIKNSTQWVRSSENLLTPRVRFRVMIDNTPDVHIEYLDKKIIPTRNVHNTKEAEFYIDLFNPGRIKIYQGAELIETLSIDSVGKLTNKQSHLIDYSCSPYKLKVEGLDGKFLSVGCKHHLTGPLGKERNRIQVTWTSPNLTLKGGKTPPFTSFHKNSNPVYITLVDQYEKEYKVKIDMRVKEKYRRTKLALGLGPYEYKTTEGVVNDEVSEWGSAFMLYGRYDLFEHASLRAFEAIVANKSIFNNFGFYFAYTLAEVMDHRLNFTALLGAQTVSFRHKKDGDLKHSAILPQGFEISMRHVFGWENYNLVYGMFLSPQSEVEYDNIWLRFGKKVFGEINYISWGEKSKKAEMFGLSIGFPIY
ncbi:MAG: hypothetical protein GY909_16490 [Oligoflexia bacterium]|nr:hypothetical protein [Oligoflexia bacterium]